MGFRMVLPFLIKLVTVLYPRDVGFLDWYPYQEAIKLKWGVPRNLNHEQKG